MGPPRRSHPSDRTSRHRLRRTLSFQQVVDAEGGRSVENSHCEAAVTAIERGIEIDRLPKKPLSNRVSLGIAIA
jgi:hypothetical protein